jgi:putative transposase
MQGKGFPYPKGQVKHQIFLGDDTFIAEYQQAIEKPEKLCEVSKAHKRSVAITLSVYQRRYSQRVEAMAKVYLSGAY